MRKNRLYFPPTISGLFIPTLSLLALLFACAGDQVSPPAEPRPFLMGFTPFPWDFSEEAVNETYAFVSEHGDIVSHHLDAGVPWPEALEDKPFHPSLEEDWNTRAERTAGMKVFLSVTPLNGDRGGMALYRGEKENLPLPEAFQNKRFNDPAVKKAYLNYCLRAAKRFQPDTMAIGIEVNELIHHQPDAWPDFVELYRETYAAIKQQYPSLPVFATVTLHNLRNTGWADMAAQQEKIKEFLAYNDVAGISYYPFMIGNTDHPEQDLRWLRDFTDKPIAFCETGFPAEDIRLTSYNLNIPGSPDAQSRYYRSLLRFAREDSYLFVISFLYRDYDALWEKIKGTSPEAFVVWKDCGLIDERGNERPALKVWDSQRAAPLKTAENP